MCVCRQTKLYYQDLWSNYLASRYIPVLLWGSTPGVFQLGAVLMLGIDPWQMGYGAPSAIWVLTTIRRSWVSGFSLACVSRVIFALASIHDGALYSWHEFAPTQIRELGCLSQTAYFRWLFAALSRLYIFR